MDLNSSDIWYWSDSTIVISWLQMSPNNLKTFVANRVSNIQNITDVQRWRHVLSKDNPADIISRGLSVNELKNSRLWWSGPTWLSLSTEQWPVSNCEHELPVPEAKSVNFLSTKADYTIFERYSNLRRLQRIVAYSLRFIDNCRTKNNRHGDLTLEELKSSLVCLIKLAQRQIFGKEINSLKNKQDVRNSKLKSLDPFLDENGILRVGGRLKNANIDFSQKHPIILPQHQLTNLIIKQKHLECLPAGVQTLLGIIRQEFWPINAKNTIKKMFVIHSD
ncbi:hypothetical protein QE152_g7582 [Popillia japonica]|uniref:Uncharacterized protein n=1 Tax=Popillia japonica TaxID=7064 RepID=A0AAW1ME99_POPJA